MARQLPKPVTLHDVARRTGLAVSTISMALADRPNISAATKARIHQACQQMGYRGPARRADGLSPQALRRRVGRFGYIVIGSNLRGEPQPATIHALSRASRSLDIRLEVSVIEHPVKPEGVMERVLEFAHGLDGLLMEGWIEPSIVQKLQAAGVPALVWGFVMGDLASQHTPICHSVSVDAVAMGRLATAHLLAKGHRRIAFLCGGFPPGLWNARWFAGYRMAHQEAGVAIDPALAALGEDWAPRLPERLSTMEQPPTAAVVPSGPANELLPQMAAAGCSVAPEAIVMGGVEQLVAELRPAACGKLTEDVELMAAVGVRLLRSICLDPLPCPVSAVVPFKVHNLS